MVRLSVNGYGAGTVHQPRRHRRYPKGIRQKGAQ